MHRAAAIARLAAITAAVGTDQVSEPEPPLPGVRTTVHFNLEAIFGPVLTALAPAEGGDALVVLRLGARS